MWSQDELLLSAILTWDGHILNRLSLVDASTILDDPLHLVVFVWPVISGKKEQFLSFIGRHDGPTVTDVGHKALLSHD